MTKRSKRRNIKEHERCVEALTRAQESLAGLIADAQSSPDARFESYVKKLAKLKNDVAALQKNLEMSDRLSTELHNLADPEENE